MAVPASRVVEDRLIVRQGGGIGINGFEEAGKTPESRASWLEC